MSQGEGGGRPTKYRAAYCKQATMLSKLGATDHEIAQFIGVADSTFKLWMAEHPKFSAAVKLGKAPADKRTERSLHHRANGYTYEAEEIFVVDKVEITVDAETGDKTIIRGKEVLRVLVVKHVPPDPTSIIFWLKNRNRAKWRDYKATEISNAPGETFKQTYTPAGPELLQDYYAKIAQAAAAADPDPRAPKDLGHARPEWDESGEDPPAGPR